MSPDIAKYINVDISNIDKLLGVSKSSLSKFMGLDIPSGAVPTEYMYLIAGNTPAAEQLNDQYYPDTWVSKTTIPSPPRDSGTAFTIGSKVYAVAGRRRDTSSRFSQVDEYDTVGDSWTNRASIASSSRWLSSFYINDKGYFVGGDGGSLANQYKTGEYVVDTWTVRATFTPGRYTDYDNGVGLNGKGYLVGAIQYTGSYNYFRDTDEYTVDTWTGKADIPAPARYYVGLVELSDVIYAALGLDSGASYLDELHSYVVNTWTTKGDPGITLSTIDFTHIEGKGYAMVSSLDHYEYDSGTDTWTSKTLVSNPRAWAYQTTA
jgi:hypothetical protein